jgi:hypothetical protein
MQISSRKFICLLLAVGMLLSGMCFEEIRADFILMEEYQEQSAEQTGNSIGIEHRTYDSEKMIHNFLQSRKSSSTLFSMKERVFSPDRRNFSPEFCTNFCEGSWQRTSKDDGVFHSKSVLCKEYRRVLLVFISPKAFTAL